MLQIAFSIIGMCYVWGISSRGRAPVLHAKGTGIDSLFLYFVPSSFCLFSEKSSPSKMMTMHRLCKHQQNRVLSHVQFGRTFYLDIYFCK